MSSTPIATRRASRANRNRTQHTFNPLLPLTIQETRRWYSKHLLRKSVRKWRNLCDVCVLSYSDYCFCFKCCLCWICCECESREQSIQYRYGIVRVREDASPEQMDIGILGRTYTCQYGVIQSMDISFQMRSPKGVTRTYLFKDIQENLDGYTQVDETEELLLAAGHSIVVYGQSSKGKSDTDKDYVQTKEGKEVPCVLADCKGKVFLKQAESRDGKKYRSLECSAYDYKVDAKNEAGHTKAFIQNWDVDLDFKLRVPGKDKRGKQLTVDIELPVKWNALQHTAYSETAVDDDDDDDKDVKIPF